MRYDIMDMHEVALLKNGKCLSKEFIDQYAPLKWMCKKGHTWDAGYYMIQRGRWCPQCIRDVIKEEYLEEIKQIAKSKGGKCLSDVYENNHTHLKFQCKNGHVWMAKSNNIKTGWWCPQCSGNAKRTLKEFQEVAKQKGGKCLSTVYVNIDTKLKWQCGEGHEWMATPYSVEKKSWCPFCAWKEAGKHFKQHEGILKYHIKDMQKFAADKGGKCLSDKYINSSSPLLWQCSEGHKWKTRSSKIIMGQWCRICGNKQAGKKKILDYKVYQKLAKKHDGQLLTPEKNYVNGNTPMKWQCKFGHIFTTKPAYIKNSDSWCPTCAGKNIYSIKTMVEFAKLHEGKCLSSKYVSTHTKLKWQCKNGHTWMGVPSSVISGSWCQQCYHQRKIYSKV
jgi:hypothetical protein